SGSVRSELDESDLDLIPGYWISTHTLYQKFLETKYNQDVDALNRAHHSAYYSFRQVVKVQDGDTAQAAEAFRQFLQQSDLPVHWRVLVGLSGMRTVPEPLRKRRDQVGEPFAEEVAAVGRSVGAMPVS